MVPPSSLLDLSIATEGEGADAAEVIARAADIVEGFAANSTGQALDALLASAELDSYGEAALSAEGIAQQTLRQTNVLSDELTRFLSVTGKR